ncbi:MAG: hypothetical protein CVV46_09465 [Spirochaetae bacterium HGW-Spirochaetae-2]|nr:MAG: hypothetical protein CVV46_09465 [Spirochaetae bacterium HGW-Spirochaetae-2]
MRRLVLSCIVIGILIVPTLSAQRNLFSETIPLQGHIELQERFSLEVKPRVFFVLNQDMAGTTHEIATYQFFSNSPEVAYQMKLSPSYVTQLGEGVFAFRNIGTTGGDSGGQPIPFKLSVVSQVHDSSSTNDAFRAVQKAIGLRDGSRSEEKGTIFVTFPSQSDGFNLQSFTFGTYEASIAVEVSAD